MSKTVTLLIVLWVSILCSHTVNADTVCNLEVNWGCPFGAPTIVGFKLYQEGMPVILWDGGDRRSGSVVLSLNQDVTVFTLTFIYADGKESVHSPQFQFDVSDAKPASPRQLQLISSMLGKLYKPDMNIVSGTIALPHV